MRAEGARGSAGGAGVKYPRVQLGDVSQIISGSTPRTNTREYWGGDMAWATPKDLSSLQSKFIAATLSNITPEGYRSCSAKLLPANSVLLSSRAPIGHVAINTVPMATNQGFKSFIPELQYLDSTYLYYWLKANNTYLQSLGRGATFKEISKSIVEKIEIPLPPLEQQKRIVRVLDKADELRSKRRRAIAKLDELLKSVFLEVFGDPVTNPKGWPVMPFGEVCNTRLGKMLDAKQQTGQHLRLYLRNTNVQWNKVNLDEVISDGL